MGRKAESPFVPIVGNPDCFTGMARTMVDAALEKALLTTPKAEPLVFRLEAYLRVTGQSLSLDQLGTERWTSTWRGFAAALGSKHFHAAHGWSYFDRARSTLAALGDHTTLSDWWFPAPTTTTKSNNDFDKFEAAVRQFENLRLDPVQVEHCRGWSFRNKKGMGVSFRLYGMHQRLGPDFTREFANACEVHVRGRSLQRIPGASELSDYIQLYPRQLCAEDFSDPARLSDFLAQFMVWFFRTAHSKGVGVENIGRQWRSFVHFVRAQLLGRAWAEPQRALPSPEIPAADGQLANVRRTANGSLIKYKLITEIPLSISDEEAVELLWHGIESDVEAVEKWAARKRAETWQNYLNRKAIAPKGQVATPTSSTVRNGSHWRLSRENPDYLSHAAATFEARGVEPFTDRLVTPHLSYPRPLDQIARELGLPDIATMQAYAALLVIRHPLITPSFLTHLELFDKHGKPKCFFQRDNYWYLKGTKGRKGPRKALQTIRLTNETKQLLDEVVALTEPARAYFKAREDHRAQLLFHTFSSIGAVPAQSPFKDFGPIRSEFAADLVDLGFTGDYAADLARRFTLPRLRASCGVLVYLETQSVQRMAEALGHEGYYPKLLDHYLPSVLQEFFMERWIRLFQTGIICHCMAGSPLILEATGLTREKLGTFLENHAIKRIPAHLLDPDNQQQHGQNLKDEPTKVVFSISEISIMLLMGLQVAVAREGSRPSGMASRWSAIADKLIPHLEADDTFRPVVDKARKSLATSKIDFSEFVHA